MCGGGEAIFIHEIASGVRYIQLWMSLGGDTMLEHPQHLLRICTLPVVNACICELDNTIAADDIGRGQRQRPVIRRAVF